MKTALYLGRFQPFHNGHLRIIEDLTKRFDRVVIALCSSQKHNTKRNPFTVWERYQMIKNTLSKRLRETQYEVIPMPDIECPERWADFTHAIFGDYDVVITNNSNIRKLFENRGDKVEGTETKTVNIKRKKRNAPDYVDTVDISGTHIRDAIACDIVDYDISNDWIYCVPCEVSYYIKKIYGVERIKKLYKT